MRSLLKRATLKTPAESATYPQVYVVTGVDKTGATDVSTAVQAIIQAAYTAGGGTVWFPPGIYRLDSALVMPDDGTGVSGSSGHPSQGRPLRLVGPGPAWDGGCTGLTITSGHAVLDLRYNGSGPAKIDTRYNGSLEITGLVLTNLGSADTKPILFDTNTMVWVHDNVFLGHSSKTGTACNQDAIVFGGQDTKTIGPAATDIFQGYGTVVERNYFDRVRRIVWARSSTNGLVIRDNMITTRCGASSSEECIGIHGGTNVGDNYPLSGIRVEGNILEIGNYAYPVRARNCSQLTATRNGFYDYTVTVLACYKFEGDASLTAYPFIMDAHYDDALWTGDLIYDTSAITGGTVNPALIARGNILNLIHGGVDTIIQPKAAQAPTTTLFEIKSSTADASGGNTQLLIVQNQGQVKVGGTGASVSVGTAGTQIGSDGSVVKQSTGRLELYAGTNSTDTVRIARGAGLANRSFTTAGRPAAAGVLAGTQCYDTTLSKPIWSDGSVWRDSAGTAV